MGNPATVPIFDPQGTLRDVPAANLSDAVKAGGMPAVRFQDPQGSVRFVPASRTADAVTHGGKMLPIEDQDVQHPGFWGALADDLGSMAKSVVEHPWSVTGAGLAYQQAKNAYDTLTGAAAEGKAAKGPGDVGYDIAKHAAENLGVNVAAMEESARTGDVGGVWGHAATIPAVMAATAGAGELAEPLMEGGAAVTKAAKPVVSSALRTVSDIASPDVTGIVSPRLAHAQRLAGKIADAIDASGPKPTFPGAPLPEATPEMQSRAAAEALPAAFQPSPARPPALPGTVEAPFQVPSEPVAPETRLPAAFQPLPPKTPTPPPLPGTPEMPFKSLMELPPVAVDQAIQEVGAGAGLAQITERANRIALKNQLEGQLNDAVGYKPPALEPGKPIYRPQAPIPVPAGMTPVESSALRSYHYDPQSQTFTAQMRSGAMYRWAEVTPEEAEDFAHADSKGQALSQIRNNHVNTAANYGQGWINRQPSISMRSASPTDVVPGAESPSAPVAASGDLTDLLQKSLEQARGRGATLPTSGPPNAAVPAAQTAEAPNPATAAVSPEPANGRSNPGAAVYEPRQPELPTASGASTNIKVPGSAQSYPARYEVRELADVQPSHSGVTLKVNPKYSLDPANLSPSANIEANAAKFKPGDHLSPTSDATKGPLVIDESGHPLGDSNENAMTLQRVYALHPDAAAAYKLELLNQSPQFGIDPIKIAHMDQPVLVRKIAAEDMPHSEAAPKPPEGEQSRPFAAPESSTTYGTQNRLVTQEDAAQARTSLRDKMFRSNTGFDPTMLADAAKLGAYHLEAGLREFGAWSQKMVDDLGDEIRPHLDALWAQVRGAGEETPNAPTFYSKAAQVVNEKVGGSGSGDQILATLRNNGVKENEIGWMGLDDFLKGKAKVSKGDLQQFIQDNQIQLEETTRGTQRQQLQAQRDKAYAEQNMLWEKLRWPGENETSIGQWMRSSDEAKAEAIRNGSISLDQLRRFQHFDDLGKQIADLDMQKAALQEKPVKYPDYTLPGNKSNYTEMLMKLPTEGASEQIRNQFASAERLRESFLGAGLPVPGDVEVKFLDAQQAMRKAEVNSPQFRSAHFDEPNILAHVRFDDRIAADGKPTLFVEEVQSDWHQQAKKKGYDVGPSAEQQQAQQSFQDATRTLNQLGLHQGAAGRIIDAKGGYVLPWNIQEAVNNPAARRFLVLDGTTPVFGGPTAESAQDFVSHNVGPNYRLSSPEEADAIHAADSTRDALARTQRDMTGRVPDAPFKSDWHELAMKRMLRYAAENGYDRIAWTTGEQQAARYDLSKQVSRIEYRPDHQMLTAFDLNGKAVIDKQVPPEQIADYVGKEPAQKLLASEPITTGAGKLKQSIEGDGLRVGGDWAKGLYDRAIPNFLNKYTKKWGGKVGETTIKGEPEVFGPLHVRSNGSQYWVGSDTHGAVSPMFDSAMKAMDARDRMMQGPTVHSLDITPAMKKSVLKEGQPISRNQALPEFEPEMATA